MQWTYHLQKAFHASRTMFRALPIIPMRQQHSHTVLSQPLGFATGEELVKNDLSSICKITKLSLLHQYNMDNNTTMSEPQPFKP